MKRLLTLSLVMALMLTGCGMMNEEMEPEPAAPVFATIPVLDEISEQPEEPRNEEPEEPDGGLLFNSTTDAQAIERLYDGRGNADWIEGYTVPRQACYTVFVAPEGTDPVQALRDSAPNCQMETLEETDLYGMYNFPELEEDPRLVLTMLEDVGNSYARYTGGMDEASVLACFDLLAKDQKILYRWYTDDPEIKCVAYDFIAVREVEPGKAVMGWYCYLIDRDDHLVCLEPEWNLQREIELNAEQLPDATAAPFDITETVTDIELSFEKTELVIGRDDPQIVVRAIPPAQFDPESVMLIDADTGEVVSKLVDDCDYEAHGDDIMGDGWYCNRYTLETDFGTDPDVSEEKTFHFYAEFVENGVCHRSEIVEIKVMEQFTEKELDDMEHVRNEFSALTGSDEWKQADTDTRRALAMDLVQRLAEEGYILPETICESEDMISYKYPCGVSAGIKLTPLSRDLN